MLDGAAAPDLFPDSASHPVSPQERVPKSGAGKKIKGEPRITVLCSTVEELVFGPRYDRESESERRKNRAKRGVVERGEWKGTDMEDSPHETEKNDWDNQKGRGNQNRGSTVQDEGPSVDIPGADKAEFSIIPIRECPAKIEGLDKHREKKLEGQRMAEEREIVRCAARRLCVFGAAVFENSRRGENLGTGMKRELQKAASTKISDDAVTPCEKTKKCEAVVRGSTVVEASFAKGDWGIRWRE